MTNDPKPMPDTVTVGTNEDRVCLATTSPSLSNVTFISTGHAREVAAQLILAADQIEGRNS